MGILPPFRRSSKRQRENNDSAIMEASMSLYIPLEWMNSSLLPRHTLCEASRLSAADSVKEQALPSPIAHNVPRQPYPQEIRSQVRRPYMDSEESCKSCLYTGVATCFGLASYFAYLAMEDELTKMTTTTSHANFNSHSFMKESGKILRLAARNKPGFLIVSAGWVVIGVHRWNLG